MPKTAKEPCKPQRFLLAQEIISEMNEEALYADGFEEALIGYVEIFNKIVALYDREKCLRILMRRDGMSEDEALEFFDFNVTGAWVGDGTPAFATLLRLKEEKPKTKKTKTQKRRKI